MAVSTGFAHRALDLLYTRYGQYAVSALLVSLLFVFRPWQSSNVKEPPSLGGSMIKNTYQYMTDMQGFLERVA